MWAGRGYGFSMGSSWSAWGSRVDVGLPQVELRGAFPGGGDRALANGLANGGNHCHLVGLPAYALEGRPGSGTRNRPSPFSGCPWTRQSPPKGALPGGQVPRANLARRLNSLSAFLVALLHLRKRFMRPKLSSTDQDIPTTRCWSYMTSRFRAGHETKLMEEQFGSFILG